MLIAPVMHSIVVFGGTGFVGRHIVARLSAAGHRVLVPTRRRERGKLLFPLPRVDVIEADVFDPPTLERLLASRDLIINLVGILQGGSCPAGQAYSPRFDRAHVQWPRRLAEQAAQLGVLRLIHLSALGADASAPSQYLRSKAAGEAALRAQPSIATTIFRPSVIFGPDDHFLNTFAHLARWLPVLFTPEPKARLQPIYVGDVATAVHYSVDHPETAGTTATLAGPEVFTLRELMEFAAAASGHPRPVLGLPASAAHLQARLMEMLPGTPLLSRDNLASLKVDSTATPPVPPGWGIEPVSLRAIAPDYLSNITRRQRELAVARRHRPQA